MKNKISNFYRWLETIPDRFYPFKRQIEGKWVRGIKSYQQTIEEGFKVLGPGKMHYRIIFYRGAWHLVGSILSIIAITFIANNVFGTEAALYILLGAAIIALCLQEFLSHPKRYNQSLQKGIFDVVTWVTPAILYLAFLTS